MLPSAPTALRSPSCSGHKQEEWRIVPAVEWRVGAEDRLLARVLERRVKRRIGLALEHVGAGGVDIGEIGPERSPEGVDESIRRDGKETEGDWVAADERRRYPPHALVREPMTRPQDVQDAR